MSAWRSAYRSSARSLEAALLSITPSYIAKLEQDRPKVGARIRALKLDIDRPLAAILSLNTIAHTVGAAGAGAEAQRLWGSDVLAVALVVLTLLILFLSEIIPKTLGAIYWRRMIGFVAGLLPPLITLLLPLVWLSEVITGFLRRRKVAQSISREEFAALARVGEEQGIFDESEGRILGNLFLFGSLRARDVMTPRTVMFSLEENTTVREALAERGSMMFSPDSTLEANPGSRDRLHTKGSTLASGSTQWARSPGECFRS